MKQRVYIDTSVIGGCIDDEFSEWSNKLFHEFRNEFKIAVVSDLTLKELEKAPVTVQEVLAQLSKKHIEYVFLSRESEDLADNYLKNKIVPYNSIIDAQHIAIASVARADVLVSWNFKHVVNLNRIRGFNSVNLKLNYPLLEIRSPMEVLI